MDKKEKDIQIALGLEKFVELFTSVTIQVPVNLPITLTVKSVFDAKEVQEKIKNAPKDLIISRLVDEVECIDYKDFNDTAREAVIDVLGELEKNPTAYKFEVHCDDDDFKDLKGNNIIEIYDDEDNVSDNIIQ